MSRETEETFPLAPREARFIAACLWGYADDPDHGAHADRSACALMVYADALDPAARRVPRTAAHCAVCGAYQPLQLDGMLRERCPDH